MPSFTADFFGAKFMGGIYGIILLAWGAAAIPSPIMSARLHQATGRFDTSIYVIAAVLAVSLILPLIVRPPRAKAAGQPQPIAQAS